MPAGAPGPRGQESWYLAQSGSLPFLGLVCLQGKRDRSLRRSQCTDWPQVAHRARRRDVGRQRWVEFSPATPVGSSASCPVGVGGVLDRSALLLGGCLPSSPAALDALWCEVNHSAQGSLTSPCRHASLGPPPRPATPTQLLCTAGSSARGRPGSGAG